jgi:hypothetical protein
MASTWQFTGTRNPTATLRRMVALTRKDASTQAAMSAANSIVMTANSHSPFSMAGQIKQWALSHLHYMPDPDEMQVLKSPMELLKDAQSTGTYLGNCADAAMLTAMLCIDVGIPCFFEARAFLKPDAPFQHVVTIAMTEKGPMEFDITRPAGTPDVVVSRRQQVKV